MISIDANLPDGLAEVIPWVRTGTAHSHMSMGNRASWAALDEADAPHVRIEEVRPNVFTFAFHSNKKHVKKPEEAICVVEFGTEGGAGVFNLIQDRRIEQD